MKPADQLRVALLAAICLACLYSFCYTMFLSSPSQGEMLAPNVKGYCSAPFAALRNCERKHVEDCSPLKERAEECAREVTKAYEVVNVKCGTYIDAWARCRRENQGAAANERPCAAQNGAMVACVDAIVKPRLESAGFGK